LEYNNELQHDEPRIIIKTGATRNIKKVGNDTFSNGRGEVYRYNIMW